MTYTKVDWDETTPLDAVNLDQMDQGIFDAHFPQFAVYSVTSTPIQPLASGVHSLIDWNSRPHHRGTWPAPNVSAVAIPETGLYRVSVAGKLEVSTSDTGWAQMTVTVNTTTVNKDAPYAVGSQIGSAGASGLVQGTSRPVLFETGDLLRVYLWHNAGSSKDLTIRADAPTFAIERVS